jgi:methylglutaconyl-CoA hydratase
MNEQTVITDVAGNGLATVTINRPDVHNAFDDELIASLTGRLEALGKDDAVRAVVLTGTGKSFSAGGDLNWMQRTASYSEEENLADAAALARLMNTLHGLSKPTIARVQGDAYGGGVGLIACCDIAVASESARFSLSEVKLGLIPAVISPYVIAAIGERQAGRYMLSAERFDAAEAWRVGLIHEVTAPDALDAAVNGIVESLLANGPRAMAEAKALIRAVAGRPIEASLNADTAARIARIRASVEGREGVAAFLGKRKPDWIKA